MTSSFACYEWSWRVESLLYSYKIPRKVLVPMVLGSAAVISVTRLNRRNKVGHNNKSSCLLSRVYKAEFSYRFAFRLHRSITDSKQEMRLHDWLARLESLSTIPGGNKSLKLKPICNF